MVKHYLISGRVQGVGFRAFTHRQSQELKLRGWVRNLDDGRVEALVAGDADVLVELESRMRQGPKHGRVDALMVQEMPGSLELPVEFEVRKDGAKPWTKSEA